MKAITSFVIIPLALAACHEQKQTSITAVQLRNEVIVLADSISKDNVLKSAAVGYTGEKTVQWKNFKALSEKATDEELMILTGDTNAVVRCYSFQALADRKHRAVFPILIRHLTDTTTVETFQGCLVGSQMAGDYFLEVVTPELIDLDAYKLTKQQRAIVDSILLFNDSVHISAKYNLLSQIQSIPAYYKRIREIAITEKNPDAVVALARFQNKNDIGIIKTMFNDEKTEYYGAYSAREFPDSSFYPYLTKIFENEWHKDQYDYLKWKMLYQALAKYPTPATYALFERTTKTADKFRYQTLGTFLLIAINKYPNPLFKPLINSIKLDMYHLNEYKEEINAKTIKN